MIKKRKKNDHKETQNNHKEAQYDQNETKNNHKETQNVHKETQNEVCLLCKKCDGVNRSFWKTVISLKR